MREKAGKISSGPLVQGHEDQAEDFELHPGVAVGTPEQENTGPEVCFRKRIVAASRQGAVWLRQAAVRGVGWVARAQTCSPTCRGRAARRLALPPPSLQLESPRQSLGARLALLTRPLGPPASRPLWLRPVRAQEGRARTLCACVAVRPARRGPRGSRVSARPLESPPLSSHAARPQEF